MKEVLMVTREPTVLVQGEPFAQREARALIGWLPRQEAIRLMLGRSPALGEDLTRIEEDIVARRDALANRPLFAAQSVLVEDNEVKIDLEQLSRNPLLSTNFAQHRWSLKIVDLTRVIAFQKAINIEGLEERVQSVVADPRKLAEFCLPGEQPVPPQGLITDVDQKGYTVSSLNPNLRIAGSQVHSALVAPEEGMQPMSMLAVTFLVSMGTSYMQVASYNGRDFLRDGYHRAAGLLRAGISTVPCVYIEAESFEEVGANPGTMLGYEVLFGDRPPFLSDFWDDSVSATVEQPTIRKAIRLRGEEFSIQG
jgi:hypothetical protein